MTRCAGSRNRDRHRKQDDGFAALRRMASAGRLHSVTQEGCRRPESGFPAPRSKASLRWQKIVPSCAGLLKKCLAWCARPAKPSCERLPAQAVLRRPSCAGVAPTKNAERFRSAFLLARCCVLLWSCLRHLRRRRCIGIPVPDAAVEHLFPCLLAPMHDDAWIGVRCIER